jgi:hypothetical protein
MITVRNRIISKDNQGGTTIVVDRIAESPHETWMVGNYLGKTQDGPQED